MNKAAKVQFTSWSPTRLADYDQCPLAAKLKHLDKLCPACFKGRIMGGFDKPEVCDTCGNVRATPVAIARGNEIHANLENFVTGENARLHADVRHPGVIAIAKELRKEYNKGRVKVELSIVMDSGWNIVDKFTKGAWLRTKLDVWRLVTGKLARVIDWKTGGIDKSTGAIASDKKYDDPLSVYSVVTLAAFPTVDYVESALVFTDAGPRFDPVVERKTCNLERLKLDKAKVFWEKRLKPMFSDHTFAPRANEKCKWCPFRKSQGGPCRY